MLKKRGENSDAEYAKIEIPQQVTLCQRSMNHKVAKRIKQFYVNQLIFCCTYLEKGLTCLRSKTNKHDSFVRCIIDISLGILCHFYAFG